MDHKINIPVEEFELNVKSKDPLNYCDFEVLIIHYSGMGTEVISGQFVPKNKYFKKLSLDKKGNKVIMNTIQGKYEFSYYHLQTAKNLYEILKNLKDKFKI